MPKGTVGELAQAPGHDFPVVIASMPASAAERRVAFAVIVFLLFIFGMVAPFARVPLSPVYAFVPVIQTVVCVAELVTAILLFAQYSIQPQLGLLALASGYIFSGLFALLQTLAFPGAYAPNGLIGDPLVSTVYLFCLWHVALPTAVLVYALSADTDANTDKSTRITIGVTVVSVLAITAVLTWVVTVGAKYLPPTFVDGTRQAPITSYMSAFIWLFSAAALLVLFKYKRTSLAVWLMVAVFATLPDLTLSTVMSTVRYTLGWYTARTYALIASFTVLAVMLTETTLLYARLTNTVLLLRRERSNRLMSLDAATAAMAHELRQPLAAIAGMSGAASIWIKRTPPVLDEAQACLAAISDSSFRANEIISGVRDLFKKSDDHRTMIHVDDVAQQVLSLVQPDLLLNEVSVTTEFQNDLPEVLADRTLIQQVILNLVRNAIDAMGSRPAPARRLRLATSVNEHSSILLSVQDTGPGIAGEKLERIFEPFFTTKPTGMGLGLSICRTVVEDHGGSLRLAKSDSNGCVFEVALPIAELAPRSTRGPSAPGS
jgi:signal transduction histidine kinase